MISYIPRIKSLRHSGGIPSFLARASFFWDSLRIRMIYESGDVDPRGWMPQWRRRVVTLSSRTKKRSIRDTMLVLISVSPQANTRGARAGRNRPEVRPGKQTERPPGVSSELRLIQNPDYLHVPQAVQAARCLTRRNGRYFALFFLGLSLRVWRSHERESKRAFLYTCAMYFSLFLFLPLPLRIGINVDVDKGIPTACLLLAVGCQFHASHRDDVEDLRVLKGFSSFSKSSRMSRKLLKKNLNLPAQNKKIRKLESKFRHINANVVDGRDL